MITFRNLGTLGRFGNQLFQYAGVRLYAELNGFSWALPAWSGDAIFTLPQHHPGIRTLGLPTVQLSDMTATGWRERLLRPFGLWRRGSMGALWTHPHDNINLYGYLQDDSSLEKLREHRNRVRAWFAYQPRIDKALREATAGRSPWVALHIRRGDLVQRGIAVPIERYLELLPTIRGTRSVFIASDDPGVIAACAAHSPFTVHPARIDAPAWAIDFWMLHHADAILAGGSTFSWWAAYLGSADYYAPPLTHQWPDGYQPTLTHRTP
ncbi:MAG: alpha-1,2-fucosyltransferase [Candidatus Yanofskybacteria bacterium]|nr:alpha-1,2-fucosyltransferase [Candidatus Yanofskybacteria bacterium]